MGDRVSISFVNNNTEEIPKESIAFFSHWDGMGLVEEAEQYVEDLKIYIDENYINSFSDPLSRLRPDVVMVDFIRHMATDKTRISSNYSVAPSSDKLDNSDNGHHQIFLT